MMTETSKKEMKVFIVEDSEDMSKWIFKELSALEGITAVEIGGELTSAKRRILDEQPDVITLDLSLSDGTGMDLLKEIKPSISDMKVIVFTNYPFKVFHDQCKAFDVDYFFDKVYDSEKIVKAVEEIRSGKNSDTETLVGRIIVI